MGRKISPGLIKRGDLWHVEKRILGHRIRESTGSESLIEAERYLNRRIEELREAVVYGVRSKRSFRQAATKFLMENQHKRSIADDAGRLKTLVDHIGSLSLDNIHMGAMQAFIDARRKTGVKTRTINHGLQVVRRILNLAANEWVDENGLTWLGHAPKIKLLPEHDLRKPYPLSWDEQNTLFRELPAHLQSMALFAVNTGCREQEVCRLRWDWEIKIPESPHLMVFVVPSMLVKNGEDRLVVCNEVARSVIESERSKHATHVFTYHGKPITKMNSTAWRNARKRVNMECVRVHDLKHTFGRRLRAAGVSIEDRQDLLGHRSERITTHYSSAELQNLHKATNTVCELKRSGVSLTLLRNPNHPARALEHTLQKTALIMTSVKSQLTRCPQNAHTGFLGA